MSTSRPGAQARARPQTQRVGAKQPRACAAQHRVGKQADTGDEGLRNDTEGRGGRGAPCVAGAWCEGAVSSGDATSSGTAQPAEHEGRSEESVSGDERGTRTDDERWMPSSGQSGPPPLRDDEASGRRSNLELSLQRQHTASAGSSGVNARPHKVSASSGWLGRLGQLTGACQSRRRRRGGCDPQTHLARFQLPSARAVGHNGRTERKSIDAWDRSVG